MKAFGKIVATVCVGLFAAICIHEKGYTAGVKDVLKENDINSFTYKSKTGNDIVYHKPSK